MVWMLYIRDAEFKQLEPLRAEAINFNTFTFIPPKGTVIFIGRAYVVEDVICDYDMRVITINVKETEWSDGN